MRPGDRRIVLLEPQPTGETRLGRPVEGPPKAHELLAVREDKAGSFGFVGQDLVSAETRTVYRFHELQIAVRPVAGMKGMDEDGRPFDVTEVKEVESGPRLRQFEITVETAA